MGGELPFAWPFFIVTHESPDDADSVPFMFVMGELAEAPVELEPQRIINAPGVTHFSDRVVK